MISIGILDERTKKGHVEKLIAAIEWCISNHIQIINLSLGTEYISDYYKLKPCIDKAYANKVIIISANSNTNKLSYPSWFTNVIGVKADDRLDTNEYYAAAHNIEQTDFFANVKHNIGYSVLSCNSYAAPFITAKVYQCLKQYEKYNLNEIKKILVEKSTKKISIQDDNYQYSDSLKCFKGKRNYSREIPYVIFCEESGDLAQSINNIMLIEGYSSLLVSTVNYIEYPYNKVESHQLNNQMLYYIESKYQADILILEISKKDLDSISELTCDVLCTKLDKQYLHALRYNKIIHLTERTNTQQLYLKLINILS